jgi:hypothetical protein
MIPMSVETMRGLKAKKDEDIRRFQVQSLIKMIYTEAVATASTKTETYYIHPIYHPQNSEEVIVALCDLFPGCRVCIKKFNRICGGTVNTCQLVEVDNIDVFADISAQDCIVIDWTRA